MPKLPKGLQDKFELVNWPGTGSRQIFGTYFRVVDLKTLTVKRAERLIQMGFPYLKKKAQKGTASKNQTKDDK